MEKSEALTHYVTSEKGFTGQQLEFIQKRNASIIEAINNPGKFIICGISRFIYFENTGRLFECEKVRHSGVVYWQATSLLSFVPYYFQYLKSIKDHFNSCEQ